MKKSGYTFDNVGAIYYKVHKTSLNSGGSYIDCPEWLRNKKVTINPKNIKDDKCFQYVITVALNYQKKLTIISKKYIILSLLLISMIGMK